VGRGLALSSIDVVGWRDALEGRGATFPAFVSLHFSDLTNHHSPSAAMAGCLKILFPLPLQPSQCQLTSPSGSLYVGRHVCL